MAGNNMETTQKSFKPFCNRIESYRINRSFSDDYILQIAHILKENSKYIVEIVVAPDYKDLKESTDFVVKLNSGDVAVRLRRWSKYTTNKDFTIRSKLNSCAETELDKLKKGFARWYLYGWVKDFCIFSWMFIDIEIVRKNKILDLKWEEKSNNDGTYFIIIPNKILYDNNAIISQCGMDFLNSKTINRNENNLKEHDFRN